MKFILAFLAGFVLVAGAFALAEHQEEQDVYVEISSPVSETSSLDAPIESTGEELYDLQEGAHAELTENTGQEVDHYYVWICVDGACVPVDPFTVNR